MPTGYSAILTEAKEPLTLRQFALRCARAFGACVEMRDESLDAAIPDAFEPSSHHKDELVKAKATLKRLSKMTKAQRAAFNKTERTKTVKRYGEMVVEQAAENKRYNDMRLLIEAWTPTPEVAELKRFMLDQIDVSVNNSLYYDEALDRAKKVDYFKEALASAKHDIEYHTKEHAAEVARTNERNAWLKALRDSLPTT